MKNDVCLDRATTSMASMGTTEIPLEDLPGTVLNDLLRELQNGTVRKPDRFNHLHFLILLLYDASGYPRDRYPLWRWYYRIKKKYLLVKHYTIESGMARQTILSALESLMDDPSNLDRWFDEAVQLEEQYLHSTIHGLFQSYSSLHTYLYLEQIEKPVINGHPKLFECFQSAILHRYRTDHCDLIHFAITHKNTNLLKKIFSEETHWLNLSMNLITERGWLPLHYAAYVGDQDSVGIDVVLISIAIHRIVILGEDPL